MQKSRMARAGGNETAGRELTGPSPHRSGLFLEQTTLANIDISADHGSARMPTSIDTSAEPALSLL
jgi:hypothetical protein